MTLIRNFAVFVSLAALLSGASVAAPPETPGLKPGKAEAAARPAPVLPVNAAASGAAPTPAPVLTQTSSSVLFVTRALNAAESGQWPELARLQQEARDPVVRNVIMWKRASEGVPGMTFDEIDHALTMLDGWPETVRMRRRAEEIIELSALDARSRVAWLDTSGPLTGAGKVALANALRETGDRARADTVIKDAWRNHSLEPDVQRTVLARYGQTLSQDDHRARADLLLWIGETSAAEAVKPQLSADYRKLVDARIALSRRSKTVDATVKAVPDTLQAHPGLLYERARWRRAKDIEGGSELLVQINGKDVPSAGRSRLWDERSIATRDELKLRSYNRAYQLTAPHGMSAGVDFAEAEWLAGWIALRLKGDATRSLGHFETMTAGVSSPMSLARGYYWTGRARDALGQADPALAAYSAAATHKFTYYGQLASERLGDKSLTLGPAPVPTAEDQARFNALPVVQAMRLFGQAGEMTNFREFAYFLDDQLTQPVDYEMLSALANEFTTEEVGVRTGKAGLQRGVIAPGAAYPVLNPSISRKPNVERAFVLAITRQESEFNPKAVSRVGARGLMQFMPATAKSEARLRGLSYQQAWLTDDPGYNMTLGGLHLDTLLSQFGGSYIMTAAAYNAGPSRPRQWVGDYGDPRTGQIDPIDWVEFIPFSETRNYVQRVLENIQVYRHRITGEPADIRLSDDLKRGRK
jgi:soluble lytic murein transglycosylase